MEGGNGGGNDANNGGDWQQSNTVCQKLGHKKGVLSREFISKTVFVKPTR